MGTGKKIAVMCKGCGTEFQALLIKIRTGGGKFCTRQCYMDYRSRNKEGLAEQRRRHQIKHKYGLTMEAYDAMLLAQDFGCAICENDLVKTPHVDHNHDTGEVRGLLCTHCNTGLGNFKDNTARLTKAIEYIDRYSRG